MSAIKCYEITYEFKASFKKTQETFYDIKYSQVMSNELIVKYLKKLSSNIINNRRFICFDPNLNLITSNNSKNEIASRTFSSIIHIKNQQFSYNSKTNSIEAKLVCLIDETYVNLSLGSVEDVLNDNMKELYSKDNYIYLTDFIYRKNKWYAYMIVDDVPTNIQIKKLNYI